MKRLGLREWVALGALAALSACTCTQNQTGGLRFSCTNNADCTDGFVCRGGECRANNSPSGTCQPTDPPRACTISGCQQVCGPDGGFGACQPVSGGPFASNPSHCGECGVACSERLGALLTCIDSRCTCILDTDCPAGHLCAPGGVCVLDTEACASVRCTGGEVCRSGTCGKQLCSAGCAVGEVCDSGSGYCRLIDACKLPGPCDDGGICEGDPRPNGEACDDGNACTHTDVCVQGSCAGTVYSCGAPNACQLSVACAGDGGCSFVARPDGTNCDDGNPCTTNDSCTGGACAGAPYTCTPGVCDTGATCNGTGGCTVTRKASGVACDDSNACTFTDVCDGDGGCAGTGYACPAPTTCQQSVACSGDGGCLVVNKTAGASCDDGLACTANDVCNASQVCAGTTVTTYLDADRDGKGDSNFPQNVCPTDGGWVLVGGDCNDSNPNVFQVMTGVVSDLDQDGYTTGSAALQCVGPSQVVNGRTYYRDTAGNYTWLAAADSLGTDCNDATANVFTNMASMGVDADNDGYYVGAAATVCVGASSVLNGRTYYKDAAGNFVVIASVAALGGSECNDANANVYRTVASLGADTDHDGYLATVPAVGSQCVGDTMVINTRTYYRNVSGTYTWLLSPGLGTDCNDADGATLGPLNWYFDADGDSFGGSTTQASCTSPGAGWVTNNTDCNDGSAIVFQNVASLVTDVDQDGYRLSTSVPATQCVGAALPISGRTYFRDISGLYPWLSSAASLGVDCYDQNPNAHPGQAAFFTGHRGDGSFDYDCSGTIVDNPASGTYCDSFNAAAFFSDSGCLTTTGVANLCNAPTVFGAGNATACGKQTQGTAGFYNPGVCTAAFRASGTLIGCH